MAHRRQQRLALVTATICVFATSLGFPAQADVEQARSYVVGGATSADFSLTPEQLEDLALMATQDGTTLSDATASFAWREPFNEIVNQIRAGYLATFAGSGVTPGGQGLPWVAFEGAAPAGALTILASSPRPVTVFEGRGFTEKELAELVTDVHYRILSSALVGDVATGYDIEEGEVLISVLPTPTAGPAEEVRAALLARLTPIQRDRVDLVIVDHPLGGSDTVYGGGSLTSCTAGFAVVSGGSTRGLSTAEHCADTQSYTGVGLLTFKAAGNDSWGDVQWHTSTDYESDDFYYNVGVRRDAAAVAFANPGLRICRFGKTTGAKCDYVYTLNRCWSTYCNLTTAEKIRLRVGTAAVPGSSARPPMVSTADSVQLEDLLMTASPKPHI